MRRRTRAATRSLLCVLLVCVSFAACASKKASLPDPDAPAAPPPDLTGLAVMILPAQAPPPGSAVRAAAGEPVPGFDAELAFFLAEQAPGVRWVTPTAVVDAAAKAPFLAVHPKALAVSAFHRSRVERIGDPLWGDLRKLGTLIDARYAILPFAAGYAVDSTGSGRIEIGAALIDTGNGNVLWTGYAAGDRGPAGDRAVVASAARALARRVAP